MTDIDPWGDPASLWPDAPEPDDGAERIDTDGWVWELMEPQERREKLELLSAWVAWLVEQANLQGTLPPCWFRHHWVRKVLTALYLGWIRTYLQRSEHRDLAESEWLATLKSFKADLQVPACLSAGRHTEPPVRPWRTDIGELRNWAQTSDWGQVEAYNPAVPLPLPEPEVVS